MNLLVCTVRDSAVDSFLRPFYVRSSGEAIRVFGDAVNGGDNGMKAHPEDYELYHIGTFEEENGVIQACDRRLLIRAVDCLK